MKRRRLRRRRRLQRRHVVLIVIKFPVMEGGVRYFGSEPDGVPDKDPGFL